MKLELAGLKPLQVAKVSLPQSKQGEGPATLTLYRKSTQLLETLYQMSTNAKVVDTKQTKSGRSAAARLLEQTARLWAMKGSIEALRDEAMREMVQQQPGAGVPTSFGVFPSSSFLKAQREKQHGLTRFGRVSIPCAPGHGREQRVLLKIGRAHV